MPALSFKPQFVDPIQRKLKRQTIRAYRKIPIKKGDTLYLYTGMRTKHCKRICDPVMCKEVDRIKLDFKNDKVFIYSVRRRTWLLFYSLKKTPIGINAFAFGDGFDGWEDMKSFWNYVDEFEGQLITW